MGYVKQGEFNPELLKEGDKLTILGVSDSMAMTTRMEVTYMGFENEEKYAQYNKLIILRIKLRKKRKERYIRLRESHLILKGWDLNIKIDTDYCSFAGNALINIVANDFKGMAEKINKHYVTGEKGIINIRDENNDLDNNAALFLERAKEIRYSHAPLNSILNKMEGR